MELLQEFLLTVGFSLLVAFLFSFVVPMLVSLCPSRDANDHVGKKAVLYECQNLVEPKIHGWGSEMVSGFVGKVVKVEDFVGETKGGNFFVQDVVEENCGSPTKSDEFEVPREVGVVCLPEKCVEEESFGGCSDRMVDESPERGEFGEIEVDLARNEEIIKVSEFEGNDHETDGAKESVADGVEKEGLLGEEDDWEGIERSELERFFGAAVAFVGSKSNADKVSGLGGDVKMRLDSLHKIATRGPCLEPQPMAFKLSARAKWNAWQQLGNMTAEEAMEQYITLLSESFPGWMQDVDGDFADAQVFENVASNLKTLVKNQSEAVGERKLEELKPDFNGLDEIGVQFLTH